MTTKTTLTEWISQVKKLSKNLDYRILSMIDEIFELIHFVDRKMLLRHKDFFEYYCNLYHKPNPIYLQKKIPVDRSIKCALCRNKKQGIVIIISQFVEKSILRITQAAKDIEWQWFEVIDFMWERPELVNPAIIDDYTESKINEVCKNHKKDNPLVSSIRNRFGKFWRDKNGKWRHERRKRF